MNESKSLAIIPKTLAEATDLAERLSKSSLLPKDMIGKMPDVLVTILAGQEMGFAPMASLRAFHVISGKPVLGADGMVALVLGSGKAIYFDRVEESDKAVTYETLRVGSKTPRRCTWTIEMAKIAALHTKDNWRTFPRAMLASRAKSELARDVYPDVLAGCYTDDELGQVSNPYDITTRPIAKTEPDAVDAEIISETPTSGSLIEQLQTAPTMEALQALAAKCNALPQKSAERNNARAAYSARQAQLVKEQAAPQAEAVP